MESGHSKKEADETWSTRASTSSAPKEAHKLISRNAPNDVHTPRRGYADDKSVGTDFRYAVEFSKIKRAPNKASQPARGQPDQRYPVRFAVSNPLVPGPSRVSPEGELRPNLYPGSSEKEWLPWPLGLIWQLRKHYGRAAGRSNQGHRRFRRPSWRRLHASRIEARHPTDQCRRHRALLLVGSAVLGSSGPNSASIVRSSQYW